MKTKVYDASALLAVVFSEPGASVVLRELEDGLGLVCAVNWAEVASKMQESGVTSDEVASELSIFDLQVCAFDGQQALATGALRPITKALGLSLGDRACLALAQSRKATVVTADRAWKKLKGFELVVIR